MKDIDPIKLPFEIPVKQVMKDAEKLEACFSDIDKSVGEAGEQFEQFVKSQLRSSSAVKDNVKATERYNRVIGLLERRMKQVQDPAVVTAYSNAIANLKKETAALASQSKGLQVARGQFDRLGTSINMITRDLPAFTYGAQMGFLAISNNIPIFADELQRLTKENKALVASGKKVKPVWKQVLGSLLSWQTALSTGIVLVTMYGKEIGAWIAKLFKGKKAVDALKERVEALNEAYKSDSYKKAVKDMLELKTMVSLAEKGIIDKKKAVDKYNETLGKAAVKVDNLAAAEKGIQDNSDSFIKAMLYKAAAAKVLDETAERLAENQKKQSKLIKRMRKEAKILALSKDFGSDVSTRVGYDKYLVKRLKVLIHKIKRLKSSSKNISKAGEENVKSLYKQIENLNIDLFKPIEKADKKVIDERKKLLEKLADIERDYARKSFTRDEEALQALRDKFDKIRQEIAAFNKSPKNKVKIDVTPLEKVQKRAESDLVYRQGTDALKRELKAEKQMYAEYESFKRKVGEKQAERRYANNLDEFKDYGARLKAEIEKLEDEITQSPDKNPTGGETERLQWLSEQLAAFHLSEQKESDKRFAQAYRSAVSYEEKVTAIKKQYASRKAEIEKISDKRIREGKLKALDFEKNDALEAASAAAYEKRHIYERLSVDLMGITRRELKNRIATLDAYLKKSKSSLTDEQKTFLQGELKKAEAIQASTDIGVQYNALLERRDALMAKIAEKGGKSTANAQEEVAELEKVDALLKNRVAAKSADLSQKAAVLSNAFKGVSSDLKGVDQGLGDTVEGMGEFLAVAGQAAGAVASFASGNIVGGITQTIGVVTEIFSMRAKARESERKALEEIDKWQDKIFQSQLDYNAELRERIQDEVKLNDLQKSRVANIQEEIEANKKARAMAMEDEQATLKRLLKAETVVGKRLKRHRGFLGFGKHTSVADDRALVGELLGYGDIGKDPRYSRYYQYADELQFTDELWEKIQKINRDKPFTGEAKAEYDALKKLVDEYGSLEEAQRQLKKELEDTTVGFTAKALGDSIKEGIESGKKSFADFSDDIEDYLRRAILSGMSAKVIEPEMQKLQDLLYSYIGDGVLTGEEKEQWEAAYMKVAKESQGYVDMMNEAGISIRGDIGGANSLKGAIKGMSEQQADLLSGQFGGLRLTQLDTNKILKNGYASQLEKLSESVRIQQQIQYNTGQTASNTAVLPTGLKNIEVAIKNGVRQTSASAG